MKLFRGGRWLELMRKTPGRIIYILYEISKPNTILRVSLTSINLFYDIPISTAGEFYM